MYVEWNDGFSVGIKTFNDQHKKLFEIINQFHAGIMEKKRKDALGILLAELMGYVKTHFEAEENEMRAHGYPDYEKHKMEHDLFLEKIKDFNRRYMADEAILTVEVLGSLVEWLDGHLNGTDKLYTPFFQGKGVR